MKVVESNGKIFLVEKTDEIYDFDIKEETSVEILSQEIDAYSDIIKNINSIEDLSDKKGYVKHLKASIKKRKGLIKEIKALISSK